ncbi:hypothetical protein, partial [Actinobacillus suis]|uniref:hypothetical protein n=1 Tax=Actinobacillus suis TaxID=716 RepID=UPI001967C725
SEVKRSNADGSVGLPHVRVGHRQIEFRTLWLAITTGFLLFYNGQRCCFIFSLILNLSLNLILIFTFIFSFPFFPFC